ncbi:MAG: TonB-dependent receptor [Candidatus Azobacteroides sp.]|nr:TonB-dependent receptor [Candidatus Azobacteroides sp.]
MRSVINKCSFTLFLFLICSAGWAQEKISFSGIVKDKDTDETLIGVNIFDKTSKAGTITDIEGEFVLEVTSGTTLEISYVGYVTREWKVTSSTKETIYLSPDSGLLDEVTVVGYGTQKKVSLTGAISSVDSRVFEDKATSNTISALQGQVPGLNIVKTQGKPGYEDWMINIRGLSSNRDLQPLIVLDGQTMANSQELSKINSNDIENITVLKDAAASIYGARAAGGVILITTKRANTVKPTISYNGNVTLQILGRNIKLMDRFQWFTNLDNAYANAGLADSHPFFLLKEYYMGKESGYAIPRDDPRFEGMASFQDVTDFTFCDTDWQDVFYGTALSTQHNMSLSGSTPKTNYYVSLGYTDQNSPLKWGELRDKRYSGRANVEMKITDNLTSITKFSYERENYVEPTYTDQAVATLMQRQPGMASQTVDGKPYAWGAQPAMNWAMELGGDTKRNFYRTNISQALEYKPVKDLTITGMAGFNDWTYRDSRLMQSVTYYDYSGTKEVLVTPTLANTKFENSWDEHFYQNYQLYANYEHIFENIHDVKVMLGTSYENDRFERTWSGRNELLISDLPSLNAGNPELATNGDEVSQWAIASYFGRFNYAYDGKYLLEANFRYDGSSRFIASERWGLFGGVSAAWRVSEEGFLKNSNVFQNLKLRASYGTAGNQEGIGIYDYIQRMALGLYPFGSDQYRYLTMGMNGMVSLDRTWETVKTANAGLDFSVLNGRLSGEIDYFRKKNDNMLIAVSYPALLGATPPATNNGSMRTTGFEVTLTWRDKIGNDFHYFITASYFDARNKMLDLGGEGDQEVWMIPYKQGHTAYSFFGYKSDGIIQNEAQLEEYKQRFSNLPSNIGVGDAMFIDKNDDGLLTAEDTYDLGSADPRYGFSASFGAEWKGFDLSAFFQGYGKIFGYNWTDRPYDNWWLNNNSYFVGRVAELMDDPSNPDAKIVANPDASYPKVSSNESVSGYNYQLSDIMLRNYGYVRLKNLTIGYTLPQQVVKKMKVEKLRLYFTGQDIWEWVKTDDGWDPERNWRDMTSSYFPSMRSWSFGVNLVF